MSYLLTLCISICLSAIGFCLPKPNKAIMVHYMPWYASKPFSGHWGWHWTMDHFNPDNIEPNGKQTIASHYQPLTGAYDSNDPALLEYQVLLMKFTGINGVIIDWYGRENFRDYSDIHRNSLNLIKHIKKAGLKFAICYEDQSVKHLINDKKIKISNDLSYAKKEFLWMEKHFFADESYLRLNSQPVLLIFGPQHFKKNQWNPIVSVLKNKVQLFTLPHLNNQIQGAGSFGWPPVHGGHKITKDVWMNYLQKLYTDHNGKPFIASVFSQFHDIYQQAGIHKSYGYLDSSEGNTFEVTFQMALKSSSEIIQVATWNDYGEGTMIEPTKEFGYRYLEFLQAYYIKNHEHPFHKNDLQLPIKLYQLRKKYQNNKSISRELDQASLFLFDSKIKEARDILIKHSH